MKPGHKRMLVATNGALLVLLAAVTIGAGGLGGLVGGVGVGGSQAFAQPPVRQRGQYVMVSGRAQGSSVNVVYVLDTVNQEMIAVRYNRSGQVLEGVGYRNVADDARQGGGGR